ncbi:MAG: PaaI family thioesterase [Acidimicrobiia bacterium]
MTENEALRRYFRHHYQELVPFHRLCGITITRWDPEGVTFELPFRHDISSHPALFHGGVMSTLIDTAGCGAVLAGHDFSRGTLIATVGLNVQYLGSAPNEPAVADAVCVRRGAISFSEVHVRSGESGALLASGTVTAKSSGRRSDDDEVRQRALDLFG